MRDLQYRAKERKITCLLRIFGRGTTHAEEMIDLHGQSLIRVSIATCRFVLLKNRYAKDTSM